MKVQKLNKELLNLYYKKDKRIYAQKVDGKVYVTDSFRAWIFKEEDFILDINKMKEVDLTKFFNEDDYITAHKENRLVEMKDGIIGSYLTSDEEDFEVLINSKYLDVFENYTLKIKSETSPVLVYECEELVSLIVPMRQY